MKFRFVLIALALALSAKSQVYQYVPFPDSVGYWKYYTVDQYNTKYWSSDEFHGDSIGQKQVMRIQSPYLYSIPNITDTFAYFEDSKRIIRLVFDTLEFVRFDFNLTVGDTFYDLLADVQSGFDDRAIVVSDDSIVSWYGNRRILTFDNGATWVEGIGNTASCRGVFDPLNSGGLGCRHFQCVFSDTASFPCADAYILSDERIANQNIETSICPNPTNGNLKLENISHLTKIEVHDLSGS